MRSPSDAPTGRPDEPSAAMTSAARQSDRGSPVGAGRELEGAAPERTDAGRTHEPPADRGLAVDLIRIVIRIKGTGVRTARAGDQAFERLDGRAAGHRQPFMFVRCDGDLADRARLRPRQLRSIVGARHGRERVETRREPGGAFESTGRHAEALARVVTEADESDSTVRAAAYERPGGVTELASHRRFVATCEPQLEVELRREARSLRLERAIQVGWR